MDKLQPTGENLGRVFNSKSGCADAMRLHYFEMKWPILKLKTWLKQLLWWSPVRYRAPQFDPICVVILINEPSKLILLATIYVVSTFPLTLLLLRAIITSLSLGKSYRQLIATLALAPWALMQPIKGKCNSRQDN
jgi:hypothetical protein